jgi:NADH:ubiquinone oxidoreductase subunit H
MRTTLTCTMFLKAYIGLYEIDQLLILLNIQHIDIIYELLLDLLKIILLLISIAYFTLAERKIMAATQRRLGPNVVGLFGLLQPLADGLKLLSKELLIPTAANTRIFLFAPVLILILSLIS